MATEIFDKWRLLVLLDNYIGIRSGMGILNNLWEYHKPRIGEYIEQFVFGIINAPIPELFISAVIGIIGYAIIG